MDVFASRQDKGVPDGVPSWARLDIPPLQCLLQSTQLIVLDNLLKAELQILEYVPQLVLVGLLELSALHRACVLQDVCHIACRVACDTISRR